MLLKDLVSSICIRLEKDTDSVTYYRIQQLCLSLRDKIILSLYSKGIIITSFDQTISLPLTPCVTKQGVFMSERPLPAMLESSKVVYTLQPNNQPVLTTSFMMLNHSSNLPTGNLPKCCVQQGMVYTNCSGTLDVYGIFYNLSSLNIDDLDSIKIDDVVAIDITTQILQMEGATSNQNLQYQVMKEQTYANKQ